MKRHRIPYLAGGDGAGEVFSRRPCFLRIWLARTGQPQVSTLQDDVG